MKKTIVMTLCCLLLVGVVNAAVISQDFEDSSEFVIDAYWGNSSQPTLNPGDSTTSAGLWSSGPTGTSSSGGGTPEAVSGNSTFSTGSQCAYLRRSSYGIEMIGTRSNDSATGNFVVEFSFKPGTAGVGNGFQFYLIDSNGADSFNNLGIRYQNQADSKGSIQTYYNSTWNTKTSGVNSDQWTRVKIEGSFVDGTYMAFKDSGTGYGPLDTQVRAFDNASFDNVAGIRVVPFYDMPADGGVYFDDISVNVPEPTTIALLSSGAVISLIRRKK